MKMLYADLKSKNVLVTGGSSGLGLAIAKAFGASDANVAIVGKSKEKLQRAKKELGGNVLCIDFDLSEIDRLPELVHQLSGSLGEIDILVNNAGINLKKDAIHVSNQEYDDVIRTNQTAVFALTREVGRAMVERRSGNIIMISSMASHYGIPRVIAYTASKSAVEGMTRALAVEWSPRGVRVNCIAPGFVMTEMSSKALDNDLERRGRVLNRTPMGKFGEPGDVANAALFLASEQSKFITGIVLPVDGGNSIGF
jgi:NAD(P)-dependent dehydrogenase (short-subunit alcohol dehydrogenase family)